MGEAEDGIGLRQVVPDAENELVWKTFECRHRSHERSSLIIEGGVNIAASPKQSDERISSRYVTVQLFRSLFPDWLTVVIIHCLRS